MAPQPLPLNAYYEDRKAVEREAKQLFDAVRRSRPRHLRSKEKDLCQSSNFLKDGQEEIEGKDLPPLRPRDLRVL
jgi:hypothetical protein